MKIVGIATRAQITDYSLPYSYSSFSVCTDSLVDTMAFLFTFTHVISSLTLCLYVFCTLRIHV